MKKIILILGDIVILYASLAITLFIRYGYLDNKIWQEHLFIFSIAFALWLLVFFINGLYDIRKIKNDFWFYGELIQNLAINTLLSVLLFYLAAGRISDLRPQTILVILMIVFGILFIAWRKIFFRILSSSTLGSNLAIIGINNETLNLIKEIKQKPQLGYKLKLIINPDNTNLPDEIQDIAVENNIYDIKKSLRQHKVDTVVTNYNSSYSTEVSTQLFDCLNLNINFYSLINFYEKNIGKIPLSSLEKNWFLENISQRNTQLLNISKRTVDLFFALLFGIISLLFVPFIILLIKIESKGPIIYKQKRVGLNDKTFYVYKFRSMIIDAEKNGAVWASKNDKRITRSGQIMRKMRIDEIPQFWNIVKGSMSFVGPRPERPEFVEQLKDEIPFYNERHLVKPGLSGWAQINYPYGASTKDAKEKLCYDLYYIKNQSAMLDVSIIMKTINAVFNIALGR